MGGDVIDKDTTNYVFAGAQSKLQWGVDYGFGEFTFQIAGGDYEGSTLGASATDRGTFVLQPRCCWQRFRRSVVRLECPPIN